MHGKYLANRPNRYQYLYFLCQLPISVDTVYWPESISFELKPDDDEDDDNDRENIYCLIFAKHHSKQLHLLAHLTTINLQVLLVCPFYQ